MSDTSTLVSVATTGTRRPNDQGLPQAKRRKLTVPPSKGDEVLIGVLGDNHPRYIEIAVRAGEQPLCQYPISDSEGSSEMEGGGEGNDPGGGDTRQTSQPAATEGLETRRDEPMQDEATPTAAATASTITEEKGETPALPTLPTEMDIDEPEKAPETTVATDDASLSAIAAEVIATTQAEQSKENGVEDALRALAGGATKVLEMNDWSRLTEPSSPELSRLRTSSPSDVRNVTLPGIDSMGLGSQSLGSQGMGSIDVLADLATSGRKDAGENPWSWCSMSPSPPPQPYPTPPSPNTQPASSSSTTTSLPMPGDISHHMTVGAPSTPGTRRSFSSNSPIDGQRPSMHHISLQEQQYVNLNSSPPSSSGNPSQQSAYYPPTSAALYPPIRDASSSTAQHGQDSTSNTFGSPNSNTTPNSANLFAQFGKSSPTSNTTSTTTIKQESRPELYGLDQISEATMRLAAAQTAAALGHPQPQITQQLQQQQQQHSVGMQTPQGPETGGSMNSMSMGSEDGGSSGARGRTPGGRVRSRGGSQAPVGGFKCEYPGCHAPPFQTQYLLK